MYLLYSGVIGLLGGSLISGREDDIFADRRTATPPAP
jgi:hypothetical protein